MPQSCLVTDLLQQRGTLAEILRSPTGQAPADLEWNHSMNASRNWTALCTSLILHAAGNTAFAQSPDAADSAAEQRDFDWKESMEWSGDLRVRFESIEREGEDVRHRSRLRGRLAFEMQATENVEVGIRIATGDGSPVSTNIGFDDGFSLKQIGLDRAYVDWSANDFLNVVIGKMRAPWYRVGRNSMQWDNDLNPEGLNLGFSTRSGLLFGSIGAFSVAERSGGNDSLLLAVQAGLNMDIGRDSKLTSTLGYFGYTNTVGNEPFYLARARGNSVDANGNFIYDYGIAEFGIELQTTVANLPFTAFAMLVNNTQVDNQNSGYAFGFRFSDLTSKDNFQINYAYHSTDADAVIGIFSDSDFAGGDTDSSGHVIRTSYAIRENIELAAHLIISETLVSSDSPVDYNRLQLDLQVSFD